MGRRIVLWAVASWELEAWGNWRALEGIGGLFGEVGPGAQAGWHCAGPAEASTGFDGVSRRRREESVRPPPPLASLWPLDAARRQSRGCSQHHPCLPLTPTVRPHTLKRCRRNTPLLSAHSGRHRLAHHQPPIHHPFVTTIERRTRRPN